MFVEKVITGLRIYDPGAHSEIIKPEPYFVFEGIAHEAVEFLGVLQAPPHLMHNLVEWLMPEYANEYVLLVSLDGKRGFPFARKAVEFPSGDERVIHLGTEDDYSAHQIKRLVRDFKSHMRANPKLADELGYIPPLPVIRKRIKFDLPHTRIAPGDIHNEILNALRSLESATDDALVWLAIAGPENERGMHPFDYYAVMREIELRQQKNMEFRSTFFPLNDVPLVEILERQERAKTLMRTFNQKFAFEFGGFDHIKAEAWIKRLDNDKLAELAVHSFYSEAGRMGEWKFFVGEFQSRMPGASKY